MLTEANVSRLVDKLTRMRGAALKLGQFLSIQGWYGYGKEHSTAVNDLSRYPCLTPASRGYLPPGAKCRSLYARLAA
jgi:hypothetical protein